MPAPRIRSTFDALTQIAQNFGQQAQVTRQTLRKINQKVDVLRAGDWVGVGATKFYNEMDSTILPAVQRLAGALERAQQATQKISDIMHRTEDECAALFRTGSSGIGSAAGAAAGGAAAGAGAAAGGAAGAAAGGAAGAAAGGAAAGGAGAGDANAVLGGAISEKNAPAKITLPDVLNKGMQDAWKDSFPGGHEQEQGAIFVQGKDGQQKWIRGPGGTGGTWTPNYGDIGDNTLIGLGHTHPYDSGEKNVPFSDADVGFLFKPDLNGPKSDKMMMVQSGDGQFVLARTEEFNKSIAGKSDSEVDTMVADMKKTYNDTVAAKKAAGAPFADRYDAAVKAVADKYHMVYYKGQNGALTKQ